MQPPGVPNAAWSAIFANFTAEVGNTMGGLQTALDNDASYLSQLGIYTPDVSRLIAFQLEQAGDFGTITQDYTPGIFGLGISNPTITAVTDPNGNVTVLTDGGVRNFTLLPAGTYQGAPGDFGTLTLNNGAYQIREADGTIESFNSNGSLNYIEDTDGNKTLYGYTGGELTSITDTATGEVTSFTYNAQGLVGQITDLNGEITTLTYDAAGHLLTTTTPAGTSSYTYVTSGTPQELNAVASITNPDGSQELFTYNSQGQLTEQSEKGGADPITYSYDVGAITATDALGDQTTELLDDNEQPVRIIDPLGNITQGTLSSDEELTSLEFAGGATSSIAYGSLGNPTTPSTRSVSRRPRRIIGPSTSSRQSPTPMATPSTSHTTQPTTISRASPFRTAAPNSMPTTR